MISAPVLQEMLRDLITKYGPPNDSNSQIYYSELKKSLGDEPREKGLLELSLTYHIPSRLYANQNTPDIIDNLVQELISQYQVDNHAAEWTVKTWAKSMGMFVAPYRPPDTDQKLQPDSRNTSKIENHPREVSFQKPVSENRSHSSSSFNPPRGNTNQRQYQQATSKAAEKKTSNQTSPFSEYKPIFGIIVILLVIAAILSGISGGGPDNSGDISDIEDINMISGPDVANGNNLDTSGQDGDGKKAADNFQDDLNPENSINSEYREGNTHISTNNFPITTEGIFIKNPEDVDVLNGNVIWTLTTENSLDIHSFVVISKEIACFATNTGEKKFLLGIDTKTGKKKWETKFGGCNAKPIELNGLIFVHEYPHMLNAYDSQTGMLIWTVNGTDPYNSGISTFGISNGILYYKKDDGQTLLIIDPSTGQINNEINSFNNISSYFSFWIRGVSNGIIIVEIDSYLYGIDITTGEVKWQMKTSGLEDVSNGVFYCTISEGLNGVNHNYLNAFDILTGNLKWKIKLNKGEIFYKGLYSHNNLLFANNNQKNLKTYEISTGQLLWESNDTKVLNVFGNSIIVMIENNLQCMDQFTGQVIWKNLNKSDYVSNLDYLGENNGAIYYYNSGIRKIYAFDSSSGEIKWIHKYNQYDPLLTPINPIGILSVQQNEDTGEYIIKSIA